MVPLGLKTALSGLKQGSRQQDKCTRVEFEKEREEHGRWTWQICHREGATPGTRLVRKERVLGPFGTNLGRPKQPSPVLCTILSKGPYSSYPCLLVLNPLSLALFVTIVLISFKSIMAALFAYVFHDHSHSGSPFSSKVQSWSFDSSGHDTLSESILRRQPVACSSRRPSLAMSRASYSRPSVPSSNFHV